MDISTPITPPQTPTTLESSTSSMASMASLPNPEQAPDSTSTNISIRKSMPAGGAGAVSAGRKRKRTTSVSSITSTDSTFGMHSLGLGLDVTGRAATPPLSTASDSSCSTTSSSASTYTTTDSSPEKPRLPRLSAVPRSFFETELESIGLDVDGKSPREQVADDISDLHLTTPVSPSCSSYPSPTASSLRSMKTRSRNTRSRKRLRFQDREEVIGRSQLALVPELESSFKSSSTPAITVESTITQQPTTPVARRFSFESHFEHCCADGTSPRRHRSPPPPGDLSSEDIINVFKFTFSHACPSLAAAALNSESSRRKSAAIQDDSSGEDLDSEDDGRGLNGIGFQPTPAQAWARTQKRRDQLRRWKMREAKEARSRRVRQRLSYGKMSSLRSSTSSSSTSAQCGDILPDRLAKVSAGALLNSEQEKGRRMVHFAV